MRKISGSERKKVDKDESVSGKAIISEDTKFFRNEGLNKDINIPLHKMRSNSTKYFRSYYRPQRKETQNTAMLKNPSSSAKGKWKF